MARLLISADAESDLENIRDFGTERFGGAIGEEYVEGFQLLFERLLDNPEQGREHAGYRRAQLRSVSYRQHKIFYDVTPDTLRIVRILHQAMDFDRHLD